MTLYMDSNKKGTGIVLRKLIRFRKGKVLPYNERNFDAEPGDKMFDNQGRLFRLEESSSFFKRASGELYPRLIKPPRPDAKFVEIDGVYCWEWPKES